MHAAVHNVNIDGLDIHSGDIQPGGFGAVTIIADPGDYPYSGNVPGNKEAGMVGALEVQKRTIRPRTRRSPKYSAAGAR